MLDKIFKNPDEKYCFQVENTFHILYFLSIIKEFKIKKVIIIINNNNNFFYKLNYEKIFNKLNYEYIVINREKNFRVFPLSLIDIIKYKTEIKQKLKIIKDYNIITPQDSTISSSLIIGELIKKNYLYALIDTTLYSIININKNLKFKIYIYYLYLLGIKIGTNTGNYYKYKFKLNYNNIDYNLIYNNKEYLKGFFIDKLEKLKYINGKKIIIFLSQPIIDEYDIDKEKFIEILNKIRSKFYEKGYNFYIKPHPLENTIYYENDFNIIDKSIPSELFDLYFIGVELIYVTFFSTTINSINFGEKYLIGNINFGKNEEKIIKSLHINFKIPFINL